MKKISLLFMAALTLGVTARAADGDEFTVDNFRYTVLSEADHEVSIVGYETKPDGDLAIPSFVSNNSSRYFVTEIGDDAFSYCSSLTSVTIPNSVTKIGKNAFPFCSNLTSVTIPNSVTEIGKNAFTSCSSLTSVTIPNSVTSIGDFAFTSCSSLTPVSIPNSVTEIGEFAFYGCSSLTSVTIPNSVTKIGDDAFGDCSSLEVLLVEEGNTEYTSEDGVLFNKGITTLVQCPGAKKSSYAIPNSVTEIGHNAFSNCSSLTSVSIPNSVTEIGYGAFSYCSSLTSVTIPNSVTVIGYSAFMNCSSLKTIFALSLTPPACISATFVGVPETAVVYIPKGSLKAYFVADGWSHFTDFREMGALDIALSESTISIEEGETATLTVTVTKDDEVTVESETWSTSNPEVATVTDGVITAVGEGAATITCTVIDGYGLPHTESCEVTVTEQSGIEDIEAGDSDAPAEYYTLNGIRVANPENGLYIKRQGGKVTKVLVK